MGTIAMLKLPITNTLLSLIVIGLVFKAEKPVQNSAIGIWQNTKQHAAVRLGCINMRLMLLRPIVLCTFQMASDLCQSKKQAPTFYSIVQLNSALRFNKTQIIFQALSRTTSRIQQVALVQKILIYSQEMLQTLTQLNQERQ